MPSPPPKPVVHRGKVEETLTNGEIAVHVLLASGRFKPGARFRYAYFAPIEMTNKYGAIQLLGVGQGSVDGASTRLLRIEQLTLKSGFRSTQLMDGNGKVLKSKMAGMVSVRMSEQEAKKMPAPPPKPRPAPPIKPSKPKPSYGLRQAHKWLQKLRVKHTIEELPKLEELNLSKKYVRDHELRHLKEMKELKELDLSFTPVSGSGLSNVASLPNLEKLNIDGTKVRDYYLARLKNAKNLRRLILPKRIKDKALLKLKKQLPNCVFVQPGRKMPQELGFGRRAIYIIVIVVLLLLIPAVITAIRSRGS